MFLLLSGTGRGKQKKKKAEEGGVMQDEAQGVEEKDWESKYRADFHKSFKYACLTIYCIKK